MISAYNQSGNQPGQVPEEHVFQGIETSSA
jgi:hypothetical protein